MTKNTKVDTEEKEEMIENAEASESKEEVTDRAEEKVDELKEKEEDWESKYNDMNDKYLRLYSEFDNFRRRTQKEKVELYKTAGEDVIVSVLPVLDDLERALNSIEDNEANKALKDGVILINQKLTNTLSQKGLKAIESSVGKEFDVNIHEAVSRIPAPSKKMKGKVIDEVEKGYMLNDKVIRYTKVVIGE